VNKYHINSETGEVGVCKATKKCPFAPLNEHYHNPESARKDYERFMEKEDLIKNGTYKSSKYTLHALNSSLEYDGPIPQWFQEIDDFKNYQNFLMPRGYKSPEIIDVIEDENLGKLAVIWEDDSLSSRDLTIQIERGCHMSRLVYRDFNTGELKGFLTTEWADDSSVKRSWGEDEWSALCYCNEWEGSSFGMEQDPFNEVKYSPYRSPLLKDDTDKERLIKKSLIWAKAHKGLNLLPESVDRSSLPWGMLINLSEDMAPKDEKILDKELKKVQDRASELYSQFKENHSTPTVDYVSLNDSHKGNGLGVSLYIYTARMLKQKGLYLSESTIQTEGSQAVWRRILGDKNIPKSLGKKSYSKNNTYDTSTTGRVDFRD